MSEHLAPADHSVKVPHLVFGLLFLGVAGIWALVVSDVITEDRLPVIAPAVLIAAGVIGLVASLASTRNRRHARTLAHEEHLRDEPAYDDGYDATAHETTDTTDTPPRTAITPDEPTEELR